jgi:hypothetical protein
MTLFSRGLTNEMQSMNIEQAAAPTNEPIESRVLVRGFDDEPTVLAMSNEQREQAAKNIIRVENDSNEAN